MAIIKFQRSNIKNKKYDALITLDDGSKKKVSFGDINHKHYKDQTPLKLYSHLDHLDNKRRENYKKRHQHDRFNKYSPGWFSDNFLW